MKKLLFNGCSFVAGDAIAWDDYVKEIGKDWSWDFYINAAPDHEVRTYGETYRQEWRRQRNLPALIAKKTNLDWVDISEDGNSNDAIALTTILWLLNIPPEERANYHVVIGWSIISRRLVYATKLDSFMSLHVNMYNYSQKNWWINDQKEYIKQTLVNANPEDHFYNYVRNILLLENFLKANGCSYTFYKSLGTEEEHTGVKLHPINNSVLKIPQPDKSLFTDNNCWYKFKENHTPSYLGESLASMFLQNRKNWVSPTNGHPNTSCVEVFSKTLGNYISKQLNN